MLQMYCNCVMFNEEGSPIHNDCLEQRRHFFDFMSRYPEEFSEDRLRDAAVKLGLSPDILTRGSGVSYRGRRSREVSEGSSSMIISANALIRSSQYGCGDLDDCDDGIMHNTTRSSRIVKKPQNFGDEVARSIEEAAEKRHEKRLKREQEAEEEERRERERKRAEQQLLHFIQASTLIQLIC